MTCHERIPLDDSILEVGGDNVRPAADCVQCSVVHCAAQQAIAKKLKEMMGKRGPRWYLNGLP